METVDVGALVEKLRAMGVDLSVEGGRIRCRTRDGRRPSLDAQYLLSELRTLGMIAVDYLEREAAQKHNESEAVKPDGTGEVHELVGMNALEASSLIDFIRNGKGELVDQFVYHKSNGRFDAKVRFLKGWAD